MDRREIIERRALVLDLLSQGKTQAEVAKVLGVSASRAGQICYSAPRDFKAYRMFVGQRIVEELV